VPCRFDPHQRGAPEQAEEVLALVGRVDHRGEAARGLGGLDAGEAVGVAPQHLALRPDLGDAGSAEHRLRHRVQCGNGAGEVVGRQQVVMRRPFEVAAAGAVEAIVVVRPGTEVARLAVIGQARVARRMRAADLLRRIGRGVVADDQLEVGEVLAEDGADGGVEVALAVEHRQADAHGRGGGVLGHGTLGADREYPAPRNARRHCVAFDTSA
jgi:hypothetical protein